MYKTVGILGGMGPEAGCDFYLRLIRLTPAQRDQDHLPVILYSQTQIPDRTEAIVGRGPSPVPHLVEAVRNLERWGAELIAVPCNTAHCFYAQMQAAVAIPVLHIVQETVAAVRRQVPSQTATVGLLATQATLGTGLYQQEMERAGLVADLPSNEHREILHQAIWLIKAGRHREAAQAVQQAMDAASDRGAQGLIFGCTELGLISELLKPPCPIFDSLDMLAQATVRQALRPKKQPETVTDQAVGCRL